MADSSTVSRLQVSISTSQIRTTATARLAAEAALVAITYLWEHVI